MKYLFHITLMLLTALLFTSCSGKKNKKESTSNQSEPVVVDNTKADLFQNSSKPFYTVDPKLEDIESEIAILKDKVIQYESQISTPNFNTEILKLIKAPKVKHEIELSNGTIIQGTIIYENIDLLIVETQIGQLQIKKDDIIGQPNDVLPPMAQLEFVGDAIEEIYPKQRAYQGSIRNDGLKRADFVRIIYELHNEYNELVAIDSAFISGTKKIFNSGIISDSSIEPGEFADFYVTIDVNESDKVTFLTREVRWDYFE